MFSQDSNLDDGGGGRRKLLLRGKTANNIPLNSRNLDGSKNRRISNRKNGVRNYLYGFHGLVSSSFSAGGYLSGAVSAFSSLPYISSLSFSSYIPGGKGNKNKNKNTNENSNQILDENGNNVENNDNNNLLEGDSGPNNGTDTTSNSTDIHHTRIRSYDFEFAYDVGILALSDEILDTHKFEIVNVTLSGE